MDNNRPLLNKLWFAYLASLVIWAVLVHGDTVNLYLQGHIFAYYQGDNLRLCDFLHYYNDGALAWEALRHGIYVYDGPLQNEFMQRLVEPELKKIFYCQYPPWHFVLMMPLPLTSLDTAWKLWVLGGFCGVIFSVYWLLRVSLQGNFTRALVYVSTLASFPGWVCFRLAQFTLFIYPAFVWFWIALKKQMWFRAGLLGGFCLLKLQYAPILFLTGFFLGRWRFFAGYAIMGFAYLISSIVILGWNNILGYPAALKYGEISGKVVGVAPHVQQNLRGQLVAIFQQDNAPVHVVAACVWILASLAMGFVWWKESKRRQLIGAEFDTGQSTGKSEPGGELKESTGRNQSSPEADRRFMVLASLTVIVLLISSPHTHRQDYLFMVIPCIWLTHVLVGEFPLKEPPVGLTSKKARGWLLALRYLLIGFPWLSWIFFYVMFVSEAIFQRACPIQPFFAWSVVILLLVLGIFTNSELSKDTLAGSQEVE